MTERELVEHAQDLLQKVKSTLRELEMIQAKDGRAEAKNAVYGARMRLGAWHSEETERLFQHFPDFAAPVVNRIGGR